MVEDMAPKTRISRRKRSIVALGCEETSRESEIDCAIELQESNEVLRSDGVNAKKKLCVGVDIENGIVENADVNLFSYGQASYQNKKRGRNVMFLYLSFEKQTVLCKASIQRFSSSGGWWYRRCSSPYCYRQLKVKKDSDKFICVQHGVQTPLPNYRVYMTIHDSFDHAIVTLMGRPAEQLFSYNCQDLVNAASYHGGQIIPEAIENAVGQEYVFEIKINYNGECEKHTF